MIRPHLSFKVALPAMLATGIFALPLNAAPDPAKPDPAVAQQLSEAQTKAAQLRGTLAQNAPHQHGGPAASPMPGMGAPAASASPVAGMGNDKMMMGKMDTMMSKMDKMMPMMEKMMGGMSGMQAGGGMSMQGMQAGGSTNQTGGMQGMQNMMEPMEGMDMMGMTSGMEGMQGMNMPQSALPGFPGASHLYHIGATGFFLDHPEHISLSTEQQVALNKIKEQTLASKSSTERQIEQAEQELATLTAADQPDLKKVEAKIRDIAKLNSDQRIAFIKAVGEAAKLLTDEQRKILTGFAPPPAAAPSPMASMSPMSDM